MRRPTLVIRIILFFMFSAVVSFWKLNNYQEDAYNRYVERQVGNSRNILYTSRIALQSNDLIEAIQLLSDSMDDGRIHFCRIQKNQEDVFTCQSAGEQNSIEIPTLGHQEVLNASDLEVRSIDVGVYSVAVGFKKNKEFYRSNYLKERTFEQILDHSLDIAIFIATFGVGLFAIILVGNRFEKRGVKRGLAKKSQFVEFDQITTGVSALEEQIEHFKIEREEYTHSIAPAILKEIKKGKQIPYDDQKIICRTDINNFTVVYSDKRTQEPFHKIVKKFLFDVESILSRYNGAIHDTQGDEAIYIFDDGSNSDQVKIAIAAIRDINKLAMEVSKETFKDLNHQFTIKSSIATGLVRFDYISRKRDFSGVPMVYSKRLLDHIIDKSKNTITLMEKDAQSLSNLGELVDRREVKFKGVSDLQTIFDFDPCIPFQKFLDPKDFSSLINNLRYFRSDEDLSLLMIFVRNTWRNTPREKIISVLNVLREFKLDSRSEELMLSYLNLLRDLLSEIPNSNELSKSAAFILSSLIGVADRIFNPSVINDDTLELFYVCLTVDDRIQANTIDALRNLRPNVKHQSIDSLKDTKNNRVAANLIVFHSVTKWDRHLEKRLQSLLSSKNSSQKASGLFALGEVGLIFKTSDLAAYKANRRLQRLIKRLPDYLFDESEMVQRQAVLALMKLDMKDKVLEAVKNQPGRLSSEQRKRIEDLVAINQIAS